VSAAVDALVSQFGSAEAVFVFAENTTTDLRSAFDLTDEQFEELADRASDDSTSP
jgi:hypothetical protein